MEAKLKLPVILTREFCCEYVIGVEKLVGCSYLFKVECPTAGAHSATTL